MKRVSEFVASRLIAGVLIVTPIYLAVLLLLKAMKSLTIVVRPLLKLLPESLHAEQALSLTVVLIACFLIGLMVRTRPGQRVWERIERALFQRIPGYEIFRSFTRRLAGQTQDEAWTPAMAEIQDGLVPAFIIEELEGGLVTIFVPSAPTPFAGDIYVLSRDRVYPLDVPFTQAIKAVSRWGSGSKYLVAAMKRRKAE